MSPIRQSRQLLFLTVAACLAACASTSPSGDGGGGGTMDAPLPAPPAERYARMNPSADYLKPGDVRTFDVTYTGQVKDIPAGTKKLRVWMPVPQDSAVQTISNLTFTGAQPAIGTEAKYGNKIAYYEIENPAATASFPMSFRVTRKEVLTDLNALADGTETDANAATFLGNDKLTFVDARVQKIADEVTAGKTTTLDKSHAIYDYVLNHMAYDKSGKGWGTGDTNFACDVGKGNCTDFHALFMSLARAEGIPAGFEIGLYAPYERKKDEKLGGYHCWTYFRVPGKTWVPIDASEADRFPERKDYFFGNHTSNRVTLSSGRDLVLVPAQDGAPLNFLLVPYVEADGKTIAGTKDWTYHDID